MIFPFLVGKLCWVIMIKHWSRRAICFGLASLILSACTSLPSVPHIPKNIALSQKANQITPSTPFLKNKTIVLINTISTQAYRQCHKALLKAGIRLFGLKATSKNPNETNKLSISKGQTSASLHAKTFAIDQQKGFIGSYNIDPRSANLNSELGVIIYDEQLANQLHNAFNEQLLHQAYEVKLQDGQLRWHSIENGKPIIFGKEPNVKIDDKIAIFLLSKLPLDGLL